MVPRRQWRLQCRKMRHRMVTPPIEYDFIDPVSVGPPRRVSEMQATLHRWGGRFGRGFDDLFPILGPDRSTNPQKEPWRSPVR